MGGWAGVEKREKRREEGRGGETSGLFSFAYQIQDTQTIKILEQRKESWRTFDYDSYALNLQNSENS